MHRLIAIFALLVTAGCTGRPVATPTAQPTASIAQPSTKPGATRLLRGSPGSPVRLLVSEGAFIMEQQAALEHSSRGQYDPEVIKVTSLAQVTILQATAAGVWVEIMDGPQAGRRGWVARDWLSQ